MSVFVGAHDRQHARGDGGFGGIRRTELHVVVVIIDFPEVAHAAFVHGAEVVLLMRVVIFAEGVEALIFCKSELR